MAIFDQYKKRLLSIIRKSLPTCKIFLFGSRARGTSSCGSDIDLALDNGTKIDPFILSTIKEEIEESSIPFFVDVVDMHVAPSGLVEEIQKDGILWNS